MTTPILPDARREWALFLDFDGTLAELESHPDQVQVPAALTDLLARLATAPDGAVAVVSGRSVVALEALLGPVPIALAGVHGLERRDATGNRHQHHAGGDVLAAARTRIEQFVHHHPGSYSEDKGIALTLHFRNAPAAAGAAAELLNAECRRLGDGYHVQHGKEVLELKPAGFDKGSVVAEFMTAPPFLGRLPVYIGDDSTDEDAFRTVRARSGHAVRVGPIDASNAEYQINSVPEVRRWLERIAAQLADSPP